MPQRLSKILNIDAEMLDQKGVFNAFVDVDSKLYVDPSLLTKAQIPEFKETRCKFDDHFNKVLSLIVASKKKGDIFWKEALKMLRFKEFKYIALGYSVGNKSGNAIGQKIAANILETASQIVEAGIEDPIIFELVGLLEKGVGTDRISDMTVFIIRQNLIKYTQRVSNELKIKQKTFGEKKEMKLPYNLSTGEPIIFVPKELLRDLPVAFSWHDIDKVCRKNEELRRKINKVIGKNWKKATSASVSKDKLKEVVLSNPELLRDLIDQYKLKPKEPYDFINDPAGEVVWAEISEKVAEHPLNFSNLKMIPVTKTNIFQVVKTICDQYGKLIEYNGWYEFLYDKAGKLRNERFAQKLFYGIADQYCLANNLNLSREPNAGSGAVDFKITEGYKEVITVEIKYSSNTNLVKGYSKQLPMYNKAERASESIYLILQTTKSDSSIKQIQKLNKTAKEKGESNPVVIVIDAKPNKPSASKIR